MDVTTSIPLHFTLQTVGFAAAGLLLAWSIVRKRWPAAAGAALLAGAEALHAGGYLAGDDDPALVVVRFAGIAFVLAAIATIRGSRRPLVVAGGAAFVGGTAWAAAAGGGISDFTVGPHVLIAVGSICLGVWAWLASRESIRLRVLTALVGILAVAIVAGGGSVSRVAALDKRNEQLAELSSAAEAVRLDIVQTADSLPSRVGVLGPAVAPALVRGSGKVDVGPDGQRESIVVVDRQRRVRFNSVHRPVFSAERVRSHPAVAAALRGVATAGYDVVSEGLVIIGASPVFRLGVPPTAANVVGAIAIVRMESPGSLKRFAASAEIAIVGSNDTAATDPSLTSIRPVATNEAITTGLISTPNGSAPAARAVIDRGLQVVLAGSDQGVVDAAKGLLRALLVAILASAVLAVIVALWLSARVTRPILDLAQGAERVKADFLSSVSHELRTPLTPIRGYTELLRRGRVPARRAATYLDEIGEAAGRLERIVTLLLDVAAMDADRFRVDATELRVDELLSEAAERWHHDVQHEMRVDIAKSLPRVYGDPDVLARTLDELVDNAVKFSPDGGVVELRARRTNRGVEVSVVDSGIGISDEQAEQLTAAFTQQESGDRRRFGGLGLGLAYVSGALAAHSSRLVVERDAEAGTAFSFTLPTASSVTRMPARSGGESTQGASRSPSR